jgi:hypothetical protein
MVSPTIREAIHQAGPRPGYCRVLVTYDSLRHHVTTPSKSTSNGASRVAAAQILSASPRGVPSSNDVDVQDLGNALAPDNGGTHSLWPWPSDYLVTLVPAVPNR